MRKEFYILAWVVIWIFVILASFEILLVAGYPYKYSFLEPYMIRYTGDSWTHNGFEIQRSKKFTALSASKKELFLFIGGSVGLEAITTDEEMSRILSDQLNRPIHFRSLCSSYKTFSDEIKIIEELDRINATIIFNTEILRFKTINEKQLVNINEKTKHEHLKYYFLPTSTYSRSIFEQYNIEVDMKHRVRLLRTGIVFGEILKKKIAPFSIARKQLKTVYNRHYVPGKPVGSKRQKEISIRIETWLENILKAQHINFQLFRAAINKAQENGNRVILADTPTNPLFDNQLNAFKPQYNKLIQNLVQEENLEYLDLRDSVDWEPEDFRDVHHMLPAGREKYTALLAEKLIQISR